MKKRYLRGILGSAFLACMMLGATGCSESVMDEINKNTSNPPVNSVDGRFQLTNAIMSMAFTTYGGLYSWTAASYTEQIFGDGGSQMMYAELRDPLVTAAPTTFNNEWNNTYHNLLNIAQMIAKCENGVNAGQEDLEGMGRVLRVMGFSALTLLHGDIPYSEALRDYIRNPKLDKQEDIYADLLKEIDLAITCLENAKEKGSANVGVQDILFQGDVGKWLGFAYAVKSRLLLDGSLRYPGNYTLALQSAEAALDNGFAGAELSIFNGVDADNSWAAYFRSRHYSGACATVACLMEERQDPRLPIYAADLFETGVLYAPAGDAAMAESIDNVGGPLWLKNEAATIHLFSEASLRFIIAECKARLGQDFQNDFREGVKASIADYVKSAGNANVGIDDPEAYISSLGTVGLKEVMIQKYLSQSRDEQIETYNDLRRLIAGGENYVTLQNPNNTDNGQNRWPYCLPYGNSDVVSNPNVAAAFGSGNSAGYYIFTIPLWIFSN
ncbi:MAG: SusD/RagB family nutrient-binding outer membrane lipoprotein [Bacteroides sp.]|nr:SusD/RagB family nutrient-binding outer membrane lipoprotein [Bacteroides sp.]